MDLILTDTSLVFGENLELDFTSNLDLETQIATFLGTKNLLPCPVRLVVTEKENHRADDIKRILLDRGWIFDSKQTLPNWVLIGVVVVVFLGLGIVVTAVLWPRTVVNQAVVSPTVSPSIIITQTPTPKTLSREDLKIKVFNGSGIAGQAKEVAQTLFALGYKDIETANFEGPKQSKTLIYYTDQVSEELLTEINQVLETDFANIETTSSGQLQNFQIHIITGR